MLVPLMPSLPWAIVVLLLRFSISQMDVPTRQAYLMEAVEPDERSAAAGITGIARTIGAAVSPVLAGCFLSSAGWIAAPFYLGGGLKVVYDLLLYRSFRAPTPVSANLPRRRSSFPKPQDHLTSSEKNGPIEE